MLCFGNFPHFESIIFMSSQAKWNSVGACNETLTNKTRVAVFNTFTNMELLLLRMTFSISENFVTKPSYHCQSIGVYHASTGWLRKQPLLDSRNHGLDTKLFVCFETCRAPHVHAMLKSIHQIVPIHSFLPSIVRSFVRSIVLSFVRSFVRCFLASFNHSVIRSFMHSCNSFHFISFYFISFHVISFHFISIHSIAFGFTHVFSFVSFHCISFISCHFMFFTFSTVC